MFTDLTKYPPSAVLLAQARNRYAKMQKLATFSCILGGLSLAVGLVVFDTTLKYLVTTTLLTAIAAAWRLAYPKNTALEPVASSLAIHLKVFAKASTPSARYYRAVIKQNRQFVNAEFRMLENEFKRASLMREQDLKSGNKRLFPPLSESTAKQELASSANHRNPSCNFVDNFPTSAGTHT